MRVCRTLCVSACVRGENVCQYVKPSRPSPWCPPTSKSEDIHSDVWRGGDLLPLSELLALLILCFPICCLSPQLRNSCCAFGARVKRGGEERERQIRVLLTGAPKNALSFCSTLCQHLLAFFWSPLPQFILFDLKDLHAKFDVICFLQTHTRSLTLGTCSAECFAC